MSMLVVSRKVNQEIILHVDGRIFAKIRPTEVRGKGTVVMAVEADPSIAIDRTEVFDKKYPAPKK